MLNVCTSCTFFTTRNVGLAFIVMSCNAPSLERQPLVKWDFWHWPLSENPCVRSALNEITDDPLPFSHSKWCGSCSCSLIVLWAYKCFRGTKQLCVENPLFSLKVKVLLRLYHEIYSTNWNRVLGLPVSLVFHLCLSFFVIPASSYTHSFYMCFFLLSQCSKASN